MSTTCKEKQTCKVLDDVSSWLLIADEEILMTVCMRAGIAFSDQPMSPK